MKYPIGVQNFEALREDGFAYVDKTGLIYKLSHECKYVFLSRPRRFGKSLLLSTIESYFRGQRNLFQGLEIEQLEHDWNSHPVIHIDLNIGEYDAAEKLDAFLISQIEALEELYGRDTHETLLSTRFAGIIRRAYEKSGSKPVVLIDEYDKPILETIGKREIHDSYRDKLRAFYSVLKSTDKYLRFAMLTGVTKFGQLSVFSGLNNLVDITFDPAYATICGITAEELMRDFSSSISSLSAAYEESEDKMLAKLAQMYDGYRFTMADVKVFNPFSVFNAFLSNRLKHYWFATGTPKYLADLLHQRRYPISNLDGAIADEERLSSLDAEDSDPLAIIYQSGYLTIRDYNPRRGVYTLGYPNEEVRTGFIKYLLPFYARTRDKKIFDIDNFVADVEDGNALAFMERLKSLTADISYGILANSEDDFQNLLYLIFTLSSHNPIVERCTSNGRIDMVVETSGYVYIMEFKINGTAEDALAQINSKEYALPWSKDDRKIIKIGACFSTQLRRLTSYIID